MRFVWTLRARGLVPSLGAGGSLVVAALCCLLLAAAVLTFRDWPGARDASPGGAFTVDVPAAKAAGRAASGPSAPVSAAPEGASPSRRADRRASERPTPARRSPGRAPVRAGTNPPPAAAPAPVRAPAPGPPPAATRPAAPVPALPALLEPVEVPGGVERVVEEVRRLEEPLSPAVREPAQPVLDIAQQAGRTVDEVTGPLPPALP